MPLDFRSRLASRAQAGPGSTLDRYLAFYRCHALVSVNASGAAAQEQGRPGFDSRLYPQGATEPELWPVVSWALSATSRPKVMATRRVGLEQPRLAARSLAGLDRPRRLWPHCARNLA